MFSIQYMVLAIISINSRTNALYRYPIASWAAVRNGHCENCFHAISLTYRHWARYEKATVMATIYSAEFYMAHSNLATINDGGCCA